MQNFVQRIRKTLAYIIFGEAIADDCKIFAERDYSEIVLETTTDFDWKGQNTEIPVVIRFGLYEGGESGLFDFILSALDGHNPDSEFDLLWEKGKMEDARCKVWQYFDQCKREARESCERESD